jgi:hypothetical protein
MRVYVLFVELAGTCIGLLLCDIMRINTLQHHRGQSNVNINFTSSSFKTGLAVKSSIIVFIVIFSHSNYHHDYLLVYVQGKQPFVKNPISRRLLELNSSRFYNSTSFTSSAVLCHTCLLSLTTSRNNFRCFIRRRRSVALVHLRDSLLLLKHSSRTHICHSVPKNR